MGNIDESIEDFTRVLEIDPDHVNAAYARGACENRRGNFEKAIEDYQMALDKDRDRSYSPDRNWRRRLNKRDILLQRELSANKQKAENQLIRVQTMNSGGERLRPAMLQSINTEEDGMTQNRQMNR
jgi:tetratricopeptide (TPR) repeat protein